MRRYLNSMVIVAQLVERRSVAAEVTGAEPVYHPNIAPIRHCGSGIFVQPSGSHPKSYENNHCHHSCLGCIEFHSFLSALEPFRERLQIEFLGRITMAK